MVATTAGKKSVTRINPFNNDDVFVYCFDSNDVGVLQQIMEIADEHAMSEILFPVHRPKDRMIFERGNRGENFTEKFKQQCFPQSVHGVIIEKGRAGALIVENRPILVTRNKKSGLVIVARAEAIELDVKTKLNTLVFESCEHRLQISDPEGIN